MSNYEGRNAEQREAEQIARRKASQGFVASTFEAVVHANLPKEKQRQLPQERKEFKQGNLGVMLIITNKQMILEPLERLEELHLT